MGTICLQCGDKGSINAFVYCVKCLKFAVHRYCLDVIPETFDEIVHWVCGDDCKGEAQNQSAVRNHDAIRSQTRNHIVSKNLGTRENIVPENVDGFCGVGTKKNDLSVIRKEEHVQKDVPKKLYDASTKVDLVNCGESVEEDALTQLGVKTDDDHDMLLHEDERKIRQLEEKKENSNSMRKMRLLKGTAKKVRKKKRRIIEPTMEKDEHIPGNTSCKKEEHVQKDVPKKLYDASTKVDLVNCCESSKEDALTQLAVKTDDEHDMLLHEDKRKVCQLEDKKENSNSMQKMRLLKGTTKKIKKKKRRIIEPTMEKDEHIPGNTSCKKEGHVQKDVPKKLYDTSTKVDLVNCRESAEEDDLTELGVKTDDDHDMLLHEDERKIYQLEEKKENSNSTRKMRLLKGPAKKIKKKKRRIIEPPMEKDEHIPGNTSYKKENNKRVKLACDTKLPNKMKDDKGSGERHEKNCTSLKSSKKKKKKTVISSHKILQEQKHSTVCGQPLVENKPLKLGNQCAEKSTEENKYSPGKDHIKNGELEQRNFANCDKNNLCDDFPKDLRVSSAEPVAMPIWRGSFSIWNEKCGILNGLLAHVSILACQKVYDEACELQPVLHLEMLPKSDVWPKSFETSEPRGDNIALYFFPSKSSERDFDRLVDEMMRKELALKAFVQNAELLIFNSSELPLLYWKFQGKYYLWGVFRQKQSSPSNSHLCRAESKGKPPIKHTDKTSVSTKGLNALSPRSPLSNSASYGSNA